ncbi:hypothetical protein [Tuberibacillus calidus]|uniref:hypothetical protein n=1 Tax=Tuberibacillus calidus TaxID=340097 RepID=UPI0006891774|nr:hypothetical protein [Tuberibacillus calidus]
MNDKAKMRLYALTSIACLVWLVEAMVRDYKNGQMSSVLSIIFYACMLIVILYTAYSALQIWKIKDKPENNHEGAN